MNTSIVLIRVITCSCIYFIGIFKRWINTLNPQKLFQVCEKSNLIFKSKGNLKISGQLYNNNAMSLIKDKRNDVCPHLQGFLAYIFRVVVNRAVFPTIT